MDKPEGIAADIWRDAWELWALLFTNRESDVVEIAKALQSERDRTPADARRWQKVRTDQDVQAACCVKSPEAMDQLYDV